MPKQKKSLSQVFLKERWPVEDMASRICELGAKRVLEIGPGGGVFTEVLLDRGLEVTAVEKDRRFAEILRSTMTGDDSKLTVICDDILRFDLRSWVATSTVPTMVVGNIPYHISTPIFEMVLPVLNQLNGAMFLTQLEFARRVAAPHGNKEYGSLSVFAQLRSDTELMFKVPRGCFKPVPKVDSGVVLLTSRQPPIAPEILIRTETICRQVFSQRRKMLSNSLGKLLADVPKEQWPFDPKQRPEELSPADFVKIAELLR